MGTEEAGPLGRRVETELTGNILPFWLQQTVDPEGEGFYARISNDGRIKVRTPKGLILNTRILWTFSAAYRHFARAEYLEMAHRAFRFLQKHFWDKKYGGMYWMLDADNEPLDTSKKIYGQAFSIYSYAEYFAASQEKAALERAFELYQLIENHNFDKKFGGYFETSNRDWSLAEDLRLSAIDMNEKKSMNTHLHMLEAYANLSRIRPEPELIKKLRGLILNFLDPIIDPRTGHFRLFFDEEWRIKSTSVSFGHDIEGSWLLDEAAAVVGDSELSQQVGRASLKMARAVLQEGGSSEGGIFYECRADGHLDEEMHWWVQVEGLVGFLNAFQRTGEDLFWQATCKIWDFCEKYLVDRINGEWFYKVGPDRKPVLSEHKVSEWKCPYHSARACMQVLTRLANLPTIQP
jgi:cellobiose epimerase